jgi:hypothetical protein
MAAINEKKRPPPSTQMLVRGSSDRANERLSTIVQTVSTIDALRSAWALSWTSCSGTFRRK